MQRLYEGLFLLDANEAAKSWTDMKGHVEGLLGRIDANIEYTERWSDKKLAYPVKGVTKGTYYLTYFRAPTQKIRELRRDAELSEKILRLLVVTEEWTETEMNGRREGAEERAKRDAEDAARAEAAAQEAPAAEAPAAEAPAETPAATTTEEAAPAAEPSGEMAEAVAAEDAEEAKE